MVLVMLVGKGGEGGGGRRGRSKNVGNTMVDQGQKLLKNTG